ncbi:MAG: hypothetical protein LBP19_05875 [Treponema sp.]|jgi:hypothetical protein|nr:hypothetical protein [Treponema sp.]
MRKGCRREEEELPIKKAILSEYGDWKNTHRRFCRWRDRDVWKTIAAEVIGEVDTGWLMIDATYSQVHADGCGAVGGNQEIGEQKGAQYESPSCYR